MLGNLKGIKRISKIEHNKNEKLYKFHIEDSNPSLSVHQKKVFFIEYYLKWLLSLGHKKAYEIKRILEYTLERVNSITDEMRTGESTINRLSEKTIEYIKSKPYFCRTINHSTD